MQNATFGCRSTPDGMHVWASGRCSGSFQCGSTHLACGSHRNGTQACPCWPAALVGAISALRLDSARFFQRQRQLCIMCPVALDFEHHRLLDWIAYHHLLGADCFVFLLDAGMMGLAEEANRELLRTLTQRRDLVAVVGPMHESRLLPSMYELMRKVQSEHASGVEHVLYMDVDE